VNGDRPLLALRGDTGLHSATTIAALAAGDLLMLGHSGTASIDLGPHKTTLAAYLL
jgi:hypothetical protein